MPRFVQQPECGANITSGLPLGLDSADTGGGGAVEWPRLRRPRHSCCGVPRDTQIARAPRQYTPRGSITSLRMRLVQARPRLWCLKSATGAWKARRSHTRSRPSSPPLASVCGVSAADSPDTNQKTCRSEGLVASCSSSVQRSSIRVNVMQKNPYEAVLQLECSPFQAMTLTSASCAAATVICGLERSRVSQMRMLLSTDAEANTCGCKI